MRREKSRQIISNFASRNFDEKELITMIYGQGSCIQNPAKPLKWSVLQKELTAKCR